MLARRSPNRNVDWGRFPVLSFGLVIYLNWLRLGLRSARIRIKVGLYWDASVCHHPKLTGSALLPIRRHP